MAGMFHYFIFATILAVVASIPNGKNEGGTVVFPSIFFNGTTTNISRPSDGAEAMRGPGGPNRIQIGNITTITNSTRPGKYYVNCPLYWSLDYTYLIWTTPDFGINNYPNDAECNLWGSSWGTYAEFKFQPLDLQKKVNGRCVDYFQLTYPYGVTKRWCGKRRVKKIRLPTYNYEAKFISDLSITRPGFNMSIRFLDSPCHTVVYVNSVGEWGEFSTPNYPNLDTMKRRMCELVVYTRWGNRVQFDFLDFDLNPPCEKNNVVLDMDSQWNYPQSTSYRYCGNSLPKSLTSTWSDAKLVYQANKRNKGFKIRYTVVPGDYYNTDPYQWTTSPYYSADNTTLPY